MSDMKTLEDLHARVGEIVVEMYDQIGTVLGAIGDHALADDLEWETQILNKTYITQTLEFRESLVDDDLPNDTNMYADAIVLLLKDIRTNWMGITKRLSLKALTANRELREMALKFFADITKHIEQLEEIAAIGYPSFFKWLDRWEVTKDKKDTQTSANLWEHYLKHMKRVYPTMAVKQFARALRFVGCEPYVGKAEGKSVRVYRGIKKKET